MCILLTNNDFFSTNIYVVGTQKNRLIEMVLLSTHKHMLNICCGYFDICCGYQQNYLIETVLLKTHNIC